MELDIQAYDRMVHKTKMVESRCVALLADWRYAQILPVGEGMNHYHQNRSSRTRQRRKKVNQVLTGDETSSWKVTGTSVFQASRSSSSLKRSRKRRWWVILNCCVTSQFSLGLTFVRERFWCKCGSLLYINILRNLYYTVTLAGAYDGGGASPVAWFVAVGGRLAAATAE